MRVINATAHSITVGNRIYSPSGLIVRAKMESVKVGEIDRVPIIKTIYKSIIGLEFLTQLANKGDIVIISRIALTALKEMGEDKKFDFMFATPGNLQKNLNQKVKRCRVLVT